MRKPVVDSIQEEEKEDEESDDEEPKEMTREQAQRMFASGSLSTRHLGLESSILCTLVLWSCCCLSSPSRLSLRLRGFPLSAPVEAA